MTNSTRLQKTLPTLADNWSSTYVTPEQAAAQYALGDQRKVRAYFEQACIAGDAITGCPTNRVFHANPGLILDYLKAVPQTLADKYRPLFDEEIDFLKKVGPQGGNIPGSIIEAHFQPYLGQRGITAIPLALKRARDILIRLLPEVEVDTSYFTVNSRSAGCSFGGKKDNLITVSEALSRRFDRPSVLSPNRAAARFQRGKVRLLGNDDIVNLYKIDYILKACKRTMQYRLPWFSGWLNPYMRLRPQIQSQLISRHIALEFDVTMMDRGLDVGPIGELILPLYERMLPAKHYATLCWYVDKAFQQPMYVNGKMYSGWHAGLSGQMIISDFESWLVLIINLAACLQAKCIPELLQVIGDDQLMFGDWTLSQAQCVQNNASSLASDVGLIMPIEKSRISYAPMFLRHFYFNGHDLLGDHGEGIYPASMAWNSIMYPENIPSTKSYAVVSTLSKADAFTNHPARDILVPLFWNNIDLPKQFSDCYVEQPGRNQHHRLDASYSLKDARMIKIGVEMGLPAARRVQERIGTF